MTVATLSDTLAGTTWQIDPAHSSIEFSIKHLVIATVKGRFGEFEGAVTLNQDGTPSVTASVATGSISTNSDQRDAHLRSADFFDVENHPVITFASTGVEGDIAGDFRLLGALTIRGTTRPIVLDVSAEGTTTDPWGGTRRAFNATGKLRRSEFGLTWNQALETGGMLVGDDVKFSIDLSFVQQ